MKHLTIAALTVAALFSACNSNNKTSQEKSSTDTTTKIGNESQQFACTMHPEIVGKKGDKCSKCGMDLTESIKKDTAQTETAPTTAVDTISSTKVETKPAEVVKATFSIEAIVTNYIKLKNALTQDNSKAAASAGQGLLNAINTANANAINTKLKKEYADIAESAKGHAQHIGNNSGKLDHQREHFATLSKDVNDLVKLFGSKQKLYQDFCPMYNDGKGAIWLSETKEIKNPFYGTSMLSCGSLKKAL